MIKRIYFLFHIRNQFVIFFLLFLQFYAKGQIVINEEQQRLYYDRTMRVKKFRDMKDFRDVFHYNKYLLGKNRISGSFSYNTQRVLIDDGKEVHKEFRHAIGYYTRIRFLEEFSINTTFYQDFNRKAHARWIADYTYAIGRYNWRPRKVNFGYENYINNKFSDSFKTFSNKFLEGYYFLSYNLALSDRATKKIRLDSTTAVRFIFFTRYAIKYRDELEVVHGGILSGKPTAGVSCRYAFFRNIYVESALYFYVDPARRKQPWDPDYSYGFGYFDYRSFRVSLTYGNWVINRFPWNKSYYPNYGFLDGNFRVIVNWNW